MHYIIGYFAQINIKENTQLKGKVYNIELNRESCYDSFLFIKNSVKLVTPPTFLCYNKPTLIEMLFES